MDCHTYHTEPNKKDTTILHATDTTPANLKSFLSTLRDLSFSTAGGEGGTIKKA